MVNLAKTTLIRAEAILSVQVTDQMGDLVCYLKLKIHDLNFFKHRILTSVVINSTNVLCTITLM